MCYNNFISSQSYKRKSKNLIKLGFNFTNPDQLEEYTKIQSILSTDYLILCESILSIMKKYNIPSTKTIHDLFKVFDIETRSLPHANSLAVERGRSVIPKSPNSHYKSGWHKTWNNNNVYLRSSYELDYAKKLDLEQIKYDVECIRIKYYSNRYNRFRIAIPDFLLLDTNTIVEIKSNYSYNDQDIKDKFIAYCNLGFKTKLILDHIETYIEW